MNGNHNIQIEINGETCTGIAYQATDGILIHLPGLQAPHAPAFETLFQPLPEERLNGGFIEAGEWDGKAFPFEGDVLFGLGPDGAVWARVCDHPDELPSAENAPANLLQAWRILADAEEALGAKSMARERAACGNWPRPHTIPDFLMWLEDEASIQEQQIADHPEEAGERMPYVQALRGLAEELRQLGFEPAPVPWTAEEGAA
jgi:hypothetical protein